MTLPTTNWGGSQLSHSLLLDLGSAPESGIGSAEVSQNHAHLIAVLLDSSLQGSSSHSEAPISSALSGQGGSDLPQIWRQQPGALRRRVEERWGPGTARTLLNLSQESDAQLFASDLFSLAQSLEGQNQREQAAAIYGLMAGESGAGLPAAARERARHRFAVVAEGGGSFGEQLELQMGTFVDGATDPTMVVGMAVGSTVFTGARSLILPRLMRGSGVLSRVPFATRFTASALATVPEVGAFWATSKGMREVLQPGSTQWDWATNGRELAGLAMTLGLLKGAGFLSGRIAQGLRSTRPEMWQHLGMLAGIGSGHGAETMLGWREWHGWMPFLTDVGVTGLQFHVGGQLSHGLFPNLYAFNHRLSGQMAQMEARQIQDLALGRRLAQMESGLRQWLFGNGEGGWPPGMAPALASGMGVPTGEMVQTSGRKGPRSRDHIVLMSSNEGPGDSGEGGVGLGGRPGQTIPVPETLPSAELQRLEGLDAFSDTHLPLRDGTNKAKFETTGSSDTFAADMLDRIPEAARNRILRELDWTPSDIQRVSQRDVPSATKDALMSIDPSDFGFVIGNIMMRGMEWFLAGDGGAYRDARIEDLEAGRQEEVRVLDEMVGLTEFAQRAGGKQLEETEAIIRGIESGLGGEGLRGYQGLKQGLINLLSPRVGRDILQPHEGAVSYGDGDMMSLLALLRHRIMPGELSWRYQLYALSRNQDKANEINENGINLIHASRDRTPLGPDKRINFRYDPKIRVVGPEGLDGVSKEDVMRSVRFQMLNVTSTGLPHILTEAYLKGLPENAILLEVIKGYMGPHRGRFRPQSHEQQSLLPFELINQALTQANRGDVEVVSGGGFIPGKDLWWGNPVRMAFAGREGRIKRFSPAAKEVADLMAGVGHNTEFLQVVHNHWQKSTEIGGAMKNVVSLLAGIRTVRLARQMLEQGRTLTEAEAQEAQGEVIQSLQTLLNEALTNEGIPEARIGFVQQVQEDFERCCFINLRAVMELVQRAMSPEVPVGDIQALTRWVKENFVESDKDGRRYQYADTRNPLVGVIAGLVEIWRSKNPALSPRDIDISMTMEGVNSLEPLVLRNTHPSHPVELRAMHPDIYELHNLFNAEAARQPLRMTPELMQALNGQVEGINPAELRSVLENCSQQAVRFITEEIRRLRRRQERAEQNPHDRRVQEQLERQLQVMPRIIEAMKWGTPTRLLDFPFYIKPYLNMFLIPVDQPQGQGPASYSYIRIDGDQANQRTTQLGLHLNSLGARARGQIDIELVGLDRRKPEEAMKLIDIENAVEEILMAHVRSHEEFQMRLTINGREIYSPRRPRPLYNQSTYWSELAPLVDWINEGKPADQRISPRDIRSARMGVRDLMVRFLRNQKGWPMLLGYFGGPIQQAIKAAFPRPENRALFGIYSGGRLRDAFTLYRGEIDGESVPMVLNQHLLAEFAEHIPEALQSTLGHPLSSSDYFNGLPVEQFRQLYTQYAQEQGIMNPQVKIIPLRSIPVERALAGRISGINPAVLRVFLQTNSEECQQMLVELEQFYSRRDEEGNSEVAEILNRYLEPFERDNPQMFQLDIIRPLYEAFRQHGHNAIWRLIDRRADHGPVSSTPPPGPVSGGSPEGQ